MSERYWWREDQEERAQPLAPRVEPTQAERDRVADKLRAYAEERKAAERPRERTDATEARLERARKDHERHLQNLLAEYRMQGFEPVYSSNGVLLSLAFAVSTGAKLVKRGAETVEPSA